MLPVLVACLGVWQARDNDPTEAMWMAREGRALLAGGPLQHLDAWSWAPQEWDFVPTSPGWEYVCAWAENLWGPQGFALLAFAISVLTLGLLALVSRELHASRTATALALTLVSVLDTSLLTSRAGAPAFALLLLQFLLVWRARHRLGALTGTKAASLAVLLGFVPAYVGIWLHGSWTLLAVGSAFGQAVLTAGIPGSKRRRILIGTTGGGAALAVIVCGPLGAAAWGNSIRVAQACAGLVKEWSSPWQLGTVWPWIWAATLLFVAWEILQTVHRPNPRNLHPLRLVLLAFLALSVVAGASAVRVLQLGILAAAPLLACRWSRPTQTRSRWILAARLGERMQEPYWRNVLALLISVAALLTLVTGGGRTPTADPAILALPQSCKLFSSDTIAKSVEYWRPDVLVWIDGRHDYWGRERLLLAQTRLRTPLPGHVVVPGTTCVLLESGRSDLVISALDQSADWRRLVTGSQLLAWVRIRPETGIRATTTAISTTRASRALEPAGSGSDTLSVTKWNNP